MPRKKVPLRRVKGSNTRLDKMRTAKRPGKRVTRNPHKHQGKTIRKSTKYSERRENRADRSRKKRL